MATAAVRYLPLVREEPRILSPVEQRHATRLAALRGVHDVFCMIVGETISLRRCLATQGVSECFGCAAPSRLCERCHGNKLAFPEVNFCDRCLANALDQEMHMPPKEVGNISVVCHLSAGRYISAATCRQMQGSQCGKCPAPTRLCRKCKLKDGYYPDYGLCLSCTVETYGSRWLENHPQVPSSKVADAALPVASRNSALPDLPIDSVKPAKATRGSIQIPRLKPLANPCGSCGQAETVFRKMRLCVDCFTARFQRGKGPRGSFFANPDAEAVFLRLLPRTVRFLAHTRWITIARIKRALRINQLEARALLTTLEDQKLVGPNRNGRYASFLRPLGEFALQLSQHPEVALYPRVKPDQVLVADNRGVLRLGREIYRTLPRWQKHRRGTTTSKLHTALRNADIAGIVGISYPGRTLARFYAQSDVQRALQKAQERKAQQRKLPLPTFDDLGISVHPTMRKDWCDRYWICPEGRRLLGRDLAESAWLLTRSGIFWLLPSSKRRDIEKLLAPLLQDE